MHAGSAARPGVKVQDTGMLDITEIDRLSYRLHGRDITRQQFIEDCVRFTAEAVDCTRCGLWVFPRSDSGRTLRCLGMYDRSAGNMVSVDDRQQDSSAAYFRALQESGHVLANDARTHPATKAFYERGLKPYGVQSLMAAAFSLNGKLFGAFTCSQVGERAVWSIRQLSILTRIGSRATLALASTSSSQLDSFLADL